jgi:hypothetical protein
MRTLVLALVLLSVSRSATAVCVIGEVDPDGQDDVLVDAWGSSAAYLVYRGGL